MEANQVETTQSVCPKCGKSVQSDFTRCPYCGAKLQVDPNDKVEKVKQGFFNFLSKAKDFFISAGKTIGKLAMSHKKITIAVSAVLILLIVLIPIITTFTNPLHPNNVTKVDVGVLTEQDVLDKYGEPYNKIDRFSTQGILLGPAIAMCREAWIYYDDAFMSKLNAFNKKVDNAESFEDLEKLDKEYNKLIKEKFDSLVVGIDQYDNVSFVCLNKNAKYDELDFFASKEPKEFKEVQLSKSTLCRGSSPADSNITYTVKYKDGSLVKAKITTNGTTNEEQTVTKINIQSIFSEFSVNIKMVDHVFDSNCLCKNCGQEHKLNEYCRCELCDRYFHDMQGCECKNCDYNTHTPDSDCKCTICNQTAHRLDENCKCTQCEIVAHKYDEDQVCIRCHADKQGLKYTLCSGKDDQGDDIQYYAVEYSPNATGTVVIPSTHQGIPVLAINAEAFRGCTSLTSITIPDSVTSIGKGAFRGCSSLESISIPFVGSSEVGSSDKYFGYIFGASRQYDHTYVPSSLKSVTITGGTSIDDNAFYLCSSLISITIPNSVTSIGEYAFLSCSSLTSITIPDSVTSIGYWAFKDCSSLTSITLTNGVTSIGERAFAGCSSLTSITIPDSVTSIGGAAFEACISLTGITIGNGVTSIGYAAFFFCHGLTSIVVQEGNTKYHSNGNCLIETESKTLILGCKTSIIPTDGSVTSIGDKAFCGCRSLTSITIPNIVTSIGRFAFSDCSSLTSITFQGTKVQWNAISKGDSWSSNTRNYTIYCTDGNISK